MTGSLDDQTVRDALAVLAPPHATRDYRPEDQAADQIRKVIARLVASVEAAEIALKEAKLHQGLPEDTPPEGVAQHFRANRELAEQFQQLAAEGKIWRETKNDSTN